MSICINRSIFRSPTITFLSKLSLKKKKTQHQNINLTMLALFPPLFSTTGWPLETSTSHADQNYVYKDTETSESRLHVPPSQPQLVDQNLHTKLTSINSGDPSMVKKLNHNASERDRRKKINILYSTLRSLLPGEDHTVLTNIFFFIPFFL